MRFVGVDLAWGGRRPSGLAVLDLPGAVVALDAPLVVRNPAGTRRAREGHPGPSARPVTPSDAGTAR